ncbi:MAG: hypothetical protein IJQ21_10645 [Lachnospiraceae bacterium]|nr:hypothetical protein [Lachnospiraceae bacterium]
MKNITNETLYEAMSGIGEDLLARSGEATTVAGKRRGKRFPRKLVFGISAAAAMFLIAILAANTLRFSGTGAPGAADHAAPAAVQEEQAKTTGGDREDAETQNMTETMESAAEEAAEESGLLMPAGGAEKESEESAYDTAAASEDMSAVFVFNGILYAEREGSRVSAEEVTIGDYVTTIEYGIDETVGAADYREGTGSIAGDVYTVSGKDPGEVLCMPEEGGTVLLLYAAE